MTDSDLVTLFNLYDEVDVSIKGVTLANFIECHNLTLKQVQAKRSSQIRLRTPRDVPDNYHVDSSLEEIL